MVSIFSENLTRGYLRSNYDSDDLRYLDGAIVYSQTATSIIDPSAFLYAFYMVGDNEGYSESISLWYWLMCILMYVVRYPIIINFVNIGFAVWSIYLIYKLAYWVFSKDNRVGLLAAKIYAFFPLPVFFCCFFYKDQFLTLITLAILYVVYSHESILKIRTIILLTILLLIFTTLRSGLLPLLILGIGYIEIHKINKHGIKNVKLKIGLILLLSIILSVILYQVFYDIILLKFDAYVTNRAGAADLGGTTIQYFIINSPTDIWKVPFSFAFTFIQPLYLGGKIGNWEGVVSLFNFCTIPIIIIDVYYIFKKKTNMTFWYVIMALIIVMLIVSMGISRHFYYLYPYVFIFYADCIIHGNKLVRKINTGAIGLSFIYFLITIPYFILS